MEAWQATVQDEAGNAVFNPQITVYESDGVTLATIYNEDGSPKANPFTGSLEGFAQFWAGPGVYKIRGSNGGQTELWESDLGGLGVAESALEAKSPPYVPFESRAQAQSTVISDDFEYIYIGDLKYRRDPNGTALTTSGGVTWSPADIVTAEHFNGSLAAAESFAARDRMPFKDGGQYVIDTGSVTSYVDKISSGNRPLGLYITQRPSSRFGIGLNYGFTRAAAEYEFAEDNTGWWRVHNGRIGRTPESQYIRYYTPELDDDSDFTFGSGTSTFTNVVGAKFRFSFSGSSLSFRHLSDNRGGVWRFFINGNSFDVSTFSPTSTNVESVVVSGLDADRLYQGYAVFIGDDPSNPPSGGAGTSRGWIWYSNVPSVSYPDDRRAIISNGSFTIRELDISVSTRDFSSSQSINEFAFQVREVGSSDPASWVPAHSGQGIAENVSSNLYIDGILADKSAVGSLRGVKSFLLTQGYDFKQNGGSINLGRLTTRHSMGPDGIMHFDYNVYAYNDFEILSWYPAQWAVSASGFTRMLMNNGGQYDLSLTPANLPLTLNNVSSLMFAGPGFTSGDSVGFAIDVDVRQAYMRGKYGVTRNSSMLFNNRSDSSATDYKIYFRANQSNPVLIEAGESFTMSSRWAVAAESKDNLQSLTGQGIV